MRRFMSLTTFIIAACLILFGKSTFAAAPSVEQAQQTELSVTEVLPTDNSSGVQVDSVITVIFNHPVISLVTSINSADLPQPLKIDPIVDGHGEWITTSR